MTGKVHPDLYQVGDNNMSKVLDGIECLLVTDYIQSALDKRRRHFNFYLEYLIVMIQEYWGRGFSSFPGETFCVSARLALVAQNL